jgi:hypothetical protein
MHSSRSRAQDGDGRSSSGYQVRRVSLIREANQEDHFGKVDGHFFLRGECRVHRLMGRFPRAIALLLAYAWAATATSPYSVQATQ